MTSLRDLSDEEFKRIYTERQRQKQAEQPFIEQAVSNAFAEKPVNKPKTFYDAKTFNLPGYFPSHYNNEADLKKLKGVATFGEGALNAATFGAAPKIEAGLGALIMPYIRPDLFGEQSYGELYKEFRDTARQQDQELMEDDPSRYIMGMLAEAAATRGVSIPGLLATSTNAGRAILKPIAKQASKVLPAAGTKKLAALKGFGYGGLQGAGESDKGPVGSFGMENVFDVLDYGAMGAALGAGGQHIYNKAFGKLSPAAEKALKRADAYKDVNIPYRKSQLTLNPNDAAKEAEYLAGKHGEKNEQAMRNHLSAQSAAYEDLASNTRNSIGSGQFIEKGRHIGEAADIVAAQHKQAKTAANTNFSEALKNEVVLQPTDFQSLPTQIAAQLKKDGLRPNIAPKAYKYLVNFSNMFKKQEGPLDLNTKVTSGEGSIIKSGKETIKTMSTTTPTKRISTDETRIVTKEPNSKITDIERNKYVTPQLEESTLNSVVKWRQTLNKAIREASKKGEGNEVDAMIKIRDMIDAHIDDIPELAPFKEANKRYRQFMDEYHADNPKQFGKKVVQDIIKNRANYTDEMITDMVLGASKLGFKKETASIVFELKKHLGPVHFEKIKLEAANKLIAPLLSGKNGGLDTYITNLAEVRRQYPTLMKHLFTPQEMTALEYLGHIGKEVLAKPKDMAGKSFKQKSKAAALWALGKRFPFIGKLVEGLQNVTSRPQLGQEAILKSVRKEGKMPRAIPEKAKAPTAGVQRATTSALSREAPAKQEMTTPPAELQKSDNKPPTQEGPAKQDLSKLSDEEFKKRYAERKNGAHLQSGTLDKIAYAESGNRNIQNPDSSASGPYQFVDKTWNAMVKKYGAQTGIKVSDKGNPKAQRIMAQLLSQENAAGLRTYLGRQPTEKEIYLAHFLGLNDAKKLMHYFGTGQIAARLLPEAAKANRYVFFANGKPRTVEQVYNLVSSKV